MPDASVSLGLDARELAAELRGAVQRFETGLDRMQRSSNRAAGGINKIATALAGLGISAEISKVVSYGATIQDMSDRFGVAASTLQKFGNAAELTGSSLEAVGKGFRFLEVNREKALSGNAAMVAAFGELGVSISDLRSLSPEQIMLKIGSSSLNAADLVKVLGKSALELRPLLSGLADGSIEFGKAISDIDIKRLKEADDRIKELKQTVTLLVGSGLAGFFEGAEAAGAALGGRIEAIQISLKGLIDTLALFAPKLGNLNPATAIEKLKQVQKIAEQVKKDMADANNRGADAAADVINEARDRRKAETEKKSKFAAPVGEGEAGATDDQGRALGGRNGAGTPSSRNKGDEGPPTLVRSHWYKGTGGLMGGNDASADLLWSDGSVTNMPGGLDAVPELGSQRQPPSPRPGRDAGLGESQAAVDEIERQRLAAEAQNALTDAAQGQPQTARERNLNQFAEDKAREGELYRKRGLNPEPQTEEEIYRERGLDPGTGSQTPYGPEEQVYRDRGLNPEMFHGKDRASDLKDGVGQAQEKSGSDLQGAAKDLKDAAAELKKAGVNQ